MPSIEKCHVLSNWYNISNVIDLFLLHLEYFWVHINHYLKKQNNKLNIFFNMKVYVSILEYYIINNFDILQPELICLVLKLSHIL